MTGRRGQAHDSAVSARRYTLAPRTFPRYGSHAPVAREPPTRKAMEPRMSRKPRIRQTAYSSSCSLRVRPRRPRLQLTFQTPTVRDAGFPSPSPERSRPCRSAKRPLLSAAPDPDTTNQPSLISSSGATAGPFTTLPYASNREPWHGQSHVFSVEFQSTMQ